MLWYSLTWYQDKLLYLIGLQSVVRDVKMSLGFYCSYKYTFRVTKTRIVFSLTNGITSHGVTNDQLLIVPFDILLFGEDIKKL